MRYKCGCVSKGMVLLSQDIFDYLTYEKWANSVGVSGTKEKCLYCWIEENGEKFGGHCGYKKGKWKEREAKG